MAENRETAVVYLRVEQELADALAVAASRDLRSVNAWASAVLEDYLVKAGYLPRS